MAEKTMRSKLIQRSIVAILIGLAIFGGGIVGTSVLVTGMELDDQVWQIAIPQIFFLLCSLVGIFVLGKRRFAAYGFQRPQNWKWLWGIPIGLALGIASSAFILFSGSSGMAGLKNLGFLQVVLLVWLLASTCEEIFVRGLMQSYMAEPGEPRFRLLIWEVSVPALICALFFAAMHIPALLNGADLPTVLTILLFTFSLGMTAGQYRSSSGSLIPPIAVHVAGNIGGVIAGILFSIYTVLTTGRPPSL